MLFPLMVDGAMSCQHGKVLVGPIDLRLEAKGVTMVIGPNGAGKTTLLRMLHGISRLSEGSIKWACDQEKAQRHQAFVFQSPIMLRRSVLDNLAYPLRLRRVPRSEAQRQAYAMSEKVGLASLVNNSASTLSGGQRQKLALGRALILSPKLLFLDEPCASLDGNSVREVEKILQMAASGGARLIMSTHNLGQARRLATEVLFLVGGKIVERSSAKRFFSNPQTEQAVRFLNGDILE